MQGCYHDEAAFHDPVFGNLNSKEVQAMWDMLLRSGKDLRVAYHDVTANSEVGSCIWEAWYTFSMTGRKVHNIIQANFEFRDGKIYRHRDIFDFWRWSQMALGMPGLLFGWTPMLRKNVSNAARNNLAKFMGRK